MASERKTCDKCGGKKPRHTIPGDPVRRLCHGCITIDSTSGIVISVFPVSAADRAERVLKISMSVPAWMMGKVGP